MAGHSPHCILCSLENKICSLPQALGPACHLLCCSHALVCLWLGLSVRVHGAQGLSTAGGRCGLLLVLTDCQGLCPDAKVKFLMWKDRVQWLFWRGTLVSKGNWEVHVCKKVSGWLMVPGQGSERAGLEAHPCSCQGGIEGVSDGEIVMEQGWVVSLRVDRRAGQEAGWLGGGCSGLTRHKGAGQLDVR